MHFQEVCFFFYQNNNFLYLTDQISFHSFLFDRLQEINFEKEKHIFFN